MTTTKVITSSTKRLESALVMRWVEGGKIALRSLSPQLHQALLRIEKFRLLSQVVWNVRLAPVKRTQWCLKSLRGFAEGILDGDCRFHEWRTSLLRQHAQSRTRVAVAASLFLFRKVIPKEMTSAQRAAAIDAYVKKLSTPSPPLDRNFDVHCRVLTGRLFREGWDRDWLQHRKNFCLPTKACLENGRSKGGARGLNRLHLREDYLRLTAGGGGLGLSRETQPMIIWTGGKWRLVTKFSCRRSYLKPLHDLIYSRLSRTPWLLRGDATAEAFKDFGRRDGEVFVSGDYESATDNLNINLTRLMLSVLRANSRHIPEPYWDEVERSVSNLFHVGDNITEQQSGQLMGSLLSFPLLCLANYLTFKWAVPRKVPLKINGDDIVFRGTVEEQKRWYSEVHSAGLVLSKGKTLVSKGYFSLNSTFFRSCKQGCELVPHIRSSCAFGSPEDANAIAGRLLDVYKGHGKSADQIRAFTLREMSKEVWSTNRSIRRGLGAVVSRRAITWAGLARREIFYCALPSEPDLPPRKSTWSQNCIPEGYERREAADGAKDDVDFVPAMIEATWTREPKVNEGKEKVSDLYWKEVRENTFTYIPPFDLRIARMAGMSKQEWVKYLTHLTPYHKRKVNKVWRKVV